MFIIGIIGSKGKTVTANSIISLLQKNKVKTNVVGSIGSSILTPDQLQAYIETISKTDSDALIINITYAGIQQGFYDNIKFDILTHTAIDEKYYKSKEELDAIIESERRLFKGLKDKSYTIINIDDDNYTKQLHDIETCVLTYGFNPKATITASSVDDNTNQLLMCQQRTIKTILGKEIIPEEFVVNIKNYDHQNIYNALATVATAQILGVKNESFKDVAF